jgi:hypothetical protein
MALTTLPCATALACDIQVRVGASRSGRNYNGVISGDERR